ncbi:hypothetical protein HMPREF3190_01084 [Umbribacter vaginalis]|nr:hypothetical protein HMPREF3190_01084 [Coriobacteriales bacterium DNF00809]
MRRLACNQTQSATNTQQESGCHKGIRFSHLVYRVQHFFMCTALKSHAYYQHKQRTEHIQ